MFFYINITTTSFLWNCVFTQKLHVLDIKQFLIGYISNKYRVISQFCFTNQVFKFG